MLLNNRFRIVADYRVPDDISIYRVSSIDILGVFRFYYNFKIFEDILYNIKSNFFHYY